MSNEIAVRKDENHPVAKTFTEDDVTTIRNAYCRDATDSEFKIFMHICESAKLNPFKRQIYFMKMGGKMTTMISIDGLRLIAERTGKYMPGRDTVYHYDDKRNLVGATAFVKKFGPDKTWHEVPATAFMAEYKGRGVWDTKPHVMISKCAESLALRKAFPDALSGLYSEEEMESAKSHEAKEKRSIQKKESLDGMEPISEQEVLHLETMLEHLDPGYRQNLLDYYSKKLWIMEDFRTFPRSELESILAAIQKRIEKEQGMNEQMEIQGVL